MYKNNLATNIKIKLQFRRSQILHLLTVLCDDSMKTSLRSRQTLLSTVRQPKPSQSNDILVFAVSLRHNIRDCPTDASSNQRDKHYETHSDQVEFKVIAVETRIPNSRRSQKFTARARTSCAHAPLKRCERHF
jgi:hypothetical protein